MDRSRASRRERVRFHRKQVVLACGACLVVAAIVGGVILTSRLLGAVPPPVKAKEPTAAAEPTAPVPIASDRSTDTPVEVPNVTGRTITEAELVLTSASFLVTSKGDTATADGSPATVVSQSPPPGTKLSQGAQVEIVVGASGGKGQRALLVVLDPGHQAKADLTTEPIGPRSPEAKEKATAGASGISTKRQECQVALELALRVKARLEAQGIEVVLTRSSNQVNLSNVQRAELANKAGADLFVRIHSDAGASPAMRGVSVMYPAGNAWVDKIAGPSKRAATFVGSAMVASTGATDGGVSARTDISGFNWSTVPTILVEAGYLSNPDDDALLANPGYQEKLASGLANGVVRFLGK